MNYKKIILLILLLTFLSGTFNINRLNIDFSFEVRYLLFLISVFIGLIGLSNNKKNMVIDSGKPTFLFLFFTYTYLVLLLFSYFYTIDQFVAIEKTETIIFLMVLIIGVIFVVNNMDIHEFFHVISMFFIIIGILYVIPIYINVFSGASRGDVNFSGPNVTTRILFFASCSSMYRLFINKKTIYFILSILFLFSLVLIGSRGGLLGAVITLLVLYVIKKFFVDWKTKKKLSIHYKYIPFFLLGISILFFIYEPVKRVFVGRFIEATFKNDTIYTSGRDIIYDDAIRMIKEKPILGYGIDSFSVNTGHVYPHNLLLEMMVEIGVIGAVFFVVFVIFSITILFKMKKSQYFIFSGIPFYMIIVQMFSGEFYDFRYFFLWMIPLLYWKPQISR